MCYHNNTCKMCWWIEWICALFSTNKSVNEEKKLNRYYLIEISLVSLKPSRFEITTVINLKCILSGTKMTKQVLSIVLVHPKRIRIIFNAPFLLTASQWIVWHVRGVTGSHTRRYLKQSDWSNLIGHEDSDVTYSRTAASQSHVPPAPCIPPSNQQNINIQFHGVQMEWAFADILTPWRTFTAPATDGIQLKNFDKEQCFKMLAGWNLDLKRPLRPWLRTNGFKWLPNHF